MTAKSDGLGLLHLYIGDGKGKTTAAIGLLARAHGCGLRCAMAQFLKGRGTGELASLEALGIPVKRASMTKFTSQMDERELAFCREEHAALLEFARQAICGGQYSLVVLDEVLDAVNARVISGEALEELLRTRPGGVEIVLTGRNPSPALREMADYISEIHAVKHPYQKGVTARRGVEY